MNSISDYELAQAVSRGVVSSMGDLYERHSYNVYLLCLKMTGDVSEAEDLTQEVFIELFSKVGSFRGESRFSTWLYRFTVNQVLMHLRRPAQRRRSSIAVEDLPASLLVKHSFASQIADHIALDSALAKLPPGSRSIFLKFDVAGYEHNEIARLFGCTTGTTKSQLHKARRKLRKLLTLNKSQSLRRPIKRIGSMP